MKKIVLVAMMIAAASYGEVKVDWKASAGFYFDPGLESLLGDATGNSTIVQLMYSADGVQDAGNLLTGIGTDGNGVGDDVFWAQLTITENSVPGDFDDYAAFSAYEERAFVSGSVYALIFQDSTVQGGDYYYYTPFLSLLNVTGSDLNQAIEMNTDVVNGNAINAGLTVGQVIPEPATMLLFGIGGFGAWLLRRRQQA